jgi:hypothetical protein
MIPIFCIFLLFVPEGCPALSKDKWELTWSIIVISGGGF